MLLDLHVLDTITPQNLIASDVLNMQRMIWRLYDGLDALFTILAGMIYLSRNVGNVSYYSVVPLIGMFTCVFSIHMIFLMFHSLCHFLLCLFSICSSSSKQMVSEHDKTIGIYKGHAEKIPEHANVWSKRDLGQPS